MFDSFSSGQVIVSFQDHSVQIVHAKAKHDELAIEKSITLAVDELDNYLASDKSRSYTVIADFATLRQEIIYLPRTKEKYLKPLIENEIKNRFADLGECSYFYNILGLDFTYEGKKWFEIAIFLVSDEEAYALIDRFARFDKTISALFLPATPIARLADLDESPDAETTFCVADMESYKSLLLLRGGKVCFTRKVPSSGPGLTDEDVQNINMTINYCTQTLKYPPTQVLIIGEPCDTDMPDIDLPIPTRWLAVPDFVRASRETVMKYLVPVAAALPVKNRREQTLLPADYSLLKARTTALAWLTMVLLLLGTLCGGYGIVKSAANRTQEKKIDALKQEAEKLTGILPAYEAQKTELEKITPFITYINKKREAPDFQKALVALSQLGKPELGRIRVKSIKMSSDAGSAIISLSGIIDTKTYTDLYAQHKLLLETAKKSGGLEITSEKLNLKDSSFELAARHRISQP